ncbi:MAG: ABC transporter substrate-binding protein [Polyangiaceae bacterium]
MRVRAAAASVGFALLGACSSSTAGSGDVSGTVQIYSWWTSGSEKQALHAFLSEYEKGHPSVNPVNEAEQSSQTAQMDLKRRMAEGNPPDTFQVNGGDELLQYVVTGTQGASQSKLENLDALAQQQGWTKVIPADVLGTVSYGGHYYAVPVDIARINSLFYNVSVFTQNGLQPPTSMADFVATAKALQAKGVTPLAVGDNGPWVLEVIFKACMVAEGGAAYYREFVTGQNAYFSGTSTQQDATFTAALQDFQSIMTYANTSTMRQLTWDQAVGLVATGSAGMTIMGDWALGEFIAQGKKPVVDFGEVAAPGSQGTFIFTTDTFVLPIGAPNRSAALSLLGEWGSAAGQAAFNPVKGSIAVRNDTDPSIYNALSQQTLRDFHSLPLVGDFALTVPATFPTVFDPALDTFVSDGNVGNVLLVVKNNYATLKSTP